MVEITPRGEAARELFLSGCNCAQSVAVAYADVIGLDRDTVMRIAQPFGAGFGRLREVCGTFSGAMFVLGQLYSSSEPNRDNKAYVYSLVQEFAERFYSARGTLLCREILGLSEGEGTDPTNPSERTAEYYASRPCAMVCAETASLLEQFLRELDERGAGVNKVGGDATIQ